MSGLKQRPDSGRENAISSGQIVRLWFFFFITFHCGNRHGLFQEITGDFSFHIVAVWEWWGTCEGEGVILNLLLSSILQWQTSFLELVCCKVLKVFCGLRCLGMSGIGVLGSLSHTLTEMCGRAFCRTYSMTQVFPDLCSSNPKTWSVRACLKISLFWSY